MSRPYDFCELAQLVYSQAHKTIAPQRLVNVCVKSCSHWKRAPCVSVDFAVKRWSNVQFVARFTFFLQEFGKFYPNVLYCISQINTGIFVTTKDDKGFSDHQQQILTHSFLYILYSGASLFLNWENTLIQEVDKRPRERKDCIQRAAVCPPCFL